MDLPGISIRTQATVDRANHLNVFDLKIIVLLFAGTLLLYWQVHGFAFNRFDDVAYITANREVQSGLNAHSMRYALTAHVIGNWSPLTLLTEMAVVQLFGSSAATMHLTSVLVHDCNVVIVYLFLRMTTRRAWLSAITAMLWGWHPLRVESVAWAGELRDVLCGFFCLLTMLAFSRYRTKPTLARYLVVAVCLSLALLSKAMAVTLPAGLLLLNVWPLRLPDETINSKWWMRRVLEQFPLVVLCAMASMAAVKSQHEGGWTGTLSQFPLPLRLANALYSYLRYIGKEFVPINMGLIYPHPGMLGRIVPVHQWLPAGIALLIISAVCWYLRKSRPFLLIGWLWFVGMLIPVIGLVQIGEQSMADRYTYLPSIGFTFAMVWLVGQWISARPAWHIPATAIAFASIAVMFAVSFKQISYWQNNLTLESHSYQVIPDDFLAMGSLSVDELSLGHTAQALGLAQSAVRLVPDNVEAHHSLANALRADGQTSAAFNEYVSAVKLDRYDAGVRIDFGRLLMQLGRFSDAQKQFQRAVDLDQDFADSHYYLATALDKLGDHNSAIAHLQTAIELNPKFGPAQGMLADALHLRGDHSGAIEHYTAALEAGETNPDWQANLAWEVAIDPASVPQQVQQLIPIARQACDQTLSQSPFPLFAYSLVLARAGQFDHAITVANSALLLAEGSHQEALAKDIRVQLAAYQNGTIAPVK